MANLFDLLVVGGGINGAAVARDAVGRGLSVYLAEARDYAHATSSASSKLIHGGIRYLEHYEFRLVRESLREREVLMRTAPHLVYPLRFLLPITKDQPRPAWMVHVGLKLYDLLSGHRLLDASGRLDARARAAIPRLRQAGVRAVMHYPDCWTDDARLTLETLLDARARGADIGNYRELESLAADGEGWRARVRTRAGEVEVRARHVVNAAGPWAARLLGRVTGADGGPPRTRGLKLVRGSHVVVPMPRPVEERAFTLQNADGRVVFVLPWLDRFLILGTTDVVHSGEPDDAVCTDAERDYLLDCYRRFFDHDVGPADIVWSWSGVRPLVDDGSANPSEVTRDYVIDVQRPGPGGLVTIYGGKLTTHRKLGEHVMEALAGEGVRMGPSWTHNAPLHGGRLDRAALARLADAGPGTIDAATRRRWAFTYGDATDALYAAVAADPAMAREVAPGIPEAELHHVVAVEDAVTAEDYLYRRTKMFILLDAPGRAAVEGWFARRNAAPVQTARLA
jgi:glycerol-3-phosphate dehydrogenase